MKKDAVMKYEKDNIPEHSTLHF